MFRENERIWKALLVEDDTAPIYNDVKVNCFFIHFMMQLFLQMKGGYGR